MRLTELFTKTRRQAPADEPSKNAQLLIRAGYINKEMAGVYSFLPLGLKVLNHIAQIIREEMNAVGGQEILMPALQLKERYEATGRWDDKVVDDWFKTKLKGGGELGLGFSHEENLSPIVANFVSSYKDLPLAIYQVQTKFRNELRAKSGLLRSREFLMKDMYSFSLNQEQHDHFYSKAQKAYHKIFERVGIGHSTYLTFASGGSFAKYSHEFQTLTEAGEDTIYLDRAKGLAVNDEVYKPAVLEELGLHKAKLEKVKAIEVGNIFHLGTKFSEPFGLKVTDDKGQQITLIMGCYGIGVGRVMGAIVELMADERGLIWPRNIAPALVYLAPVGGGKSVGAAADKLYEELSAAGVTVLYDDRDVSAGEKFADADLLGIPYRLVVSEETVKNGRHELKSRQSAQTDHFRSDELLKFLLAKT